MLHFFKQKKIFPQAIFGFFYCLNLFFPSYSYGAQPKATWQLADKGSGQSPSGTSFTLYKNPANGNLGVRINNFQIKRDIASQSPLTLMNTGAVIDPTKRSFRMKMETNEVLLENKAQWLNKDAVQAQLKIENLEDAFEIFELFPILYEINNFAPIPFMSVQESPEKTYHVFKNSKTNTLFLRIALSKDAGGTSSGAKIIISIFRPMEYSQKLSKFIMGSIGFVYNETTKQYGKLSVDSIGKVVLKYKPENPPWEATINKAFDFFPKIIDVSNTESILKLFYKSVNEELAQTTFTDRHTIETVASNLIIKLKGLTPIPPPKVNIDKAIDLEKVKLQIIKISAFFNILWVQEALIDLDTYKSKKWLLSTAPDKNPGAEEEVKKLYEIFNEKDDIKCQIFRSPADKKNVDTIIASWKQQLHNAELELNQKKEQLKQTAKQSQEAQQLAAVQLYGSTEKTQDLYTHDLTSDIQDMFIIYEQGPPQMQSGNFLLQAARNKTLMPFIRIFDNAGKEIYRIIKTDTAKNEGCINRLRDNKVYFITIAGNEFKLKITASNQNMPFTVDTTQGTIQFFDPRMHTMTAPLKSPLAKACTIFKNFDNELSKINLLGFYQPFLAPEAESPLQEKLIALKERLSALKDRLTELVQKLIALQNKL